MENKNDELLDLVNEKDEVIGTVLRSTSRKDPSKIYRIVSITLFNEKGETLLQKRASNKSHPGKWENAGSGHVLAGENPDVTAKREILEELGVNISLNYFDKKLVKSETKTKFMWMYYAVIPSDTKFIIDKDEVEEVVWIFPHQLKDFAKNNYWDLKGMSHVEIMEIKNFLGI